MKNQGVLTITDKTQQLRVLSAQIKDDIWKAKVAMITCLRHIDTTQPVDKEFLAVKLQEGLNSLDDYGVRYD